MTNKIIRLESLSLMDHDDDRNDGGIFQTTRLIEVGHPYDEPHFKTVYDGSYRKLVEYHSDRDVVSIDSIRSLCDSDGYCYLVKLKDGNELYLPIHAFIAETKEVTDDEV
ncbi:hypothetical protein ETB91_11730 [Lacticaseibacillus rhamnosus]|uniref:hypothetical protein n=1 Tax=Lacticaseibacillus rhamnosus TaxID=47715 RepID=UPI001013C853|nr:hypothetical protein [Lacticaseibacillus rhamnosus]RXS53340.1 hypothetical protein ETB91_11730 [Lacticaseibacillus rhamnosus]